MKKVIFTVIIGDTDDLKEVTKITPGWEYVCITDNPNITSSTWNIKLVSSGDSKKLSRYYKIKNHFPTYDLSIFIDGTFTVKRDLDLFTQGKYGGIWFNKHPMRQCAYEEAEVVVNKGLDDSRVIDQITRYQLDGLPPQFGLWRCGVIIRNPKDPKITELCDRWYEEIERGTWRDQVSLPYVCWKMGITPNTIPYGLSEAYFKQSLHKANPTPDWKFVGEGDYDKTLIDKYPTAHLIVLKNGILFPRWLNNYISLKNGVERFIELVKILNGTIVRG